MSTYNVIIKICNILNSEPVGMELNFAPMPGMNIVLNHREGRGAICLVKEVYYFADEETFEVLVTMTIREIDKMFAERQKDIFQRWSIGERGRN